MNMLKLTAAAALVAASLSASAMTTIADEDLSAVAGQDGVSIAANLNVNIGSFSYINTSATQGSSVNFNNISITGLVAVTVDVLNNATAAGEIGALVTGYDTARGNTAGIATDLAAISPFLGTSDVVQFAFPNLGASHTLSPTITVGSITLGSGTASFGSFQIKNLDLQGTTVLMWAH
jgi:hypothetical protein